MPVALVALDDDGVRRSLLELGSDPASGGAQPGSAGALVKSEIIRWTPVLEPAGR